MLCSCHSENSFLFVATEYLRVHKGYFYSPIYVMNRHVLLFLYGEKASRFQLDYSSLIERNKKKHLAGPQSIYSSPCQNSKTNTANQVTTPKHPSFRRRQSNAGIGHASPSDPSPESQNESEPENWPLASKPRPQKA